jgi:hypothetical protein
MKGQLAVKTPKQYLAALEEPRRGDLTRLDKLIRKVVPKLKPFIHAGLLAYGPYRYKYASGREGDWFRIGLASNKAYVSLYVCAADARGYVAERYRDLLPKASIGKSCVRFKRLDDLDLAVVSAMLKEGSRVGFDL